MIKYQRDDFKREKYKVEGWLSTQSGRTGIWRVYMVESLEVNHSLEVIKLGFIRLK